MPSPPPPSAASADVLARDARGICRVTFYDTRGSGNVTLDRQMADGARLAQRFTGPERLIQLGLPVLGRAGPNVQATRGADQDPARDLSTRLTMRDTLAITRRIGSAEPGEQSSPA